MDKVLEIAQRMLNKRAEKLAHNKAEIASKYPHALVDTLVFDETTQKYKLQIRCTECGDQRRWLFTSDLHQTRFCDTCTERYKKAKKELRKAQIYQARMLIKKGLV